MKKILASQFFKLLLGNRGHYWSEFGNMNDLYRILFGSCHYWVSASATYKHKDGNVPQWMSDPYTGDQGYANAYRDVSALLSLSGRITRLRRIQDQIHSWLCQAGLSESDLAVLSAYYVPVQASREDMTVYIAHVMQYVLQTC